MKIVKLKQEGPAWHRWRAKGVGGSGAPTAAAAAQRGPAGAATIGRLRGVAGSPCPSAPPGIRHAHRTVSPKGLTGDNGAPRFALRGRLRPRVALPNWRPSGPPP